MATQKEMFLARFGDDDHIKDAVTSKDSPRVMAAMNRDVMPEKSAKMFYNNPRSDVLKPIVLKHINDPSYVINAYEEHNYDPKVVGAAIQHPLGIKYADDWIKKKNNPRGSYLDDAAKNPKLTESHIETLLSREGNTDHDNKIRETAAIHPNISDESIHKILSGSDDNLKNVVLKNKKITPEHIDKALNDSNEEVRKTAISGNNVSSQNLHKGLNDSNIAVRERTIDNPKCKKEHFEHASKDSHQGIRVYAKNRLDGVED